MGDHVGLAAALRRQYAKNAAQLAEMRDKARRTGRTVGGFTLVELEDRAATFARLAAGTDDEIINAVRGWQLTGRLGVAR
jgi:hypothetical protein